MRRAAWTSIALLASGVAFAGPPYVSDDPEPTDFEHYEIYAFTDGSVNAAGRSGSAGIDFNYGATKDLQLTAVLPVEYEPGARGIGNVELAAKYRFRHQSDGGWDVAFFPRLFLPSASARLGERHASLLLPLWVERDFGPWATFGGGGCAIDRGGDAKDWCVAGWALTRQVTDALNLGAELVHQTSSVRGEPSSTAVGGGLRYDIGKTVHLLAYFGPGLQDREATARYSWYGSVLLTF